MQTYKELITDSIAVCFCRVVCLRESGRAISREPVVLYQVTVNSKEIEIVDSAKLVGGTISSNLTWNAHKSQKEAVLFGSDKKS